MCINQPATFFTVMDVGEIFDFSNDQMFYYDGPIQGIVTCKLCNEPFLFYCEVILESFAWHWFFFRPAAGRESDYQAILQREPAWFSLFNAREKSQPWLSILEDRRMASEIQCHCVWMIS